jgi:hypothetical protein
MVCNSCSDEKSRGRVFGKYSSDTTTSGSGGSGGGGGGNDASSSASESGGSGMASVVGSSAAAAMSALHQSYDTTSSSGSSTSSGSGSGSGAGAMETTASDIAAVDQADGEVIRDKYHFILQHIQKLVTAAEENYMMVCKENWIKNQTSKINMGIVNQITLLHHHTTQGE